MFYSVVFIPFYFLRFFTNLSSLMYLFTDCSYHASNVFVPGEGSINSFVNKVLSETEQFFRKPELQLQQPAGKILQAVALGSVEA